MVASDPDAKRAEEDRFVSTIAFGALAPNAAAARYVNMAVAEANARIVEEVKYASTAAKGVNAKTVEAARSADMAVAEANARNVEEVKSANTSANGADAKSVEEARSALMVARDAIARNAEMCAATINPRGNVSSARCSSWNGSNKSLSRWKGHHRHNIIPSQSNQRKNQSCTNMYKRQSFHGPSSPGHNLCHNHPCYSHRCHHPGCVRQSTSTNQSWNRTTLTPWLAPIRNTTYTSD
eukprot:TRINITY_DN1254_c0_g1_i1.p2 TRINITY_DN1254_c0_g1~~TRINITY_DN1254_c0_g1_i1.p2  ORF type:complete len:238 (-),score=39.95 TRINITY_DN1254_c0_g1_i1:66-779(-)